jgi:hypothetical protein
MERERGRVMGMEMEMEIVAEVKDPVVRGIV